MREEKKFNDGTTSKKKKEKRGRKEDLNCNQNIFFTRYFNLFVGAKLLHFSFKRTFLSITLYSSHHRSRSWPSGAFDFLLECWACSQSKIRVLGSRDIFLQIMAVDQSFDFELSVTFRKNRFVFGTICFWINENC